MRALAALSWLIVFYLHAPVWAQHITLEGYVFEDNNRGYINMAKINIVETKKEAPSHTAITNKEGFFTINLPLDRDFVIEVKKDLFEPEQQNITTKGLNDGDKLFTKHRLQRKPGYIFDVTLAEKRIKDNPTDAITEAWIEVYNNTKKQEVLDLIDHPLPTFSVTFERGNHYTILIRKDGYLAKRMEAYVDVEGCILCFDGVGEVRPGVSDNLSYGHQMGTLIANVELIPITLDQTLKIENIYYDYNQWAIRQDAAEELDKLIVFLKDNPQLIVEVGSHTDARGDAPYNLNLSQQRAQAAVDYIISKGEISPARIIARGYGESKLVNRCRSSVNCSEQEHQQNRRTELTIVGFLPKEQYVRRSLADMLQPEVLEWPLAEIPSSAISESSYNDTLKVPANSPDLLMDDKELNVPEKQDLTAKTDYDSTPDRPVNLTAKGAEPVSEQQQTTVQSPGSTHSIAIESVAGDRARQKVEKSTNTEADRSHTVGERFKVARAAPIHILEEYEISGDLPPRGPTLLPDSYHGYRVEFYQSVYKLPISHMIFTQHGNITIEQKKDGTFAYLLGAFSNRSEAEHLAEVVLKSRYPNASVVRYVNGKRYLEND